MVAYPLAHLTQDDRQEVSGPIQDDEALALFALIRCMRMRNVVELGGLAGYSARNFCAAVGPQGRVVTLDLVDVPKVADNHVVVVGDATAMDLTKLGEKRFDLVFLDCHDYAAEWTFVTRLTQAGLIDDDSVIAAHDTNVHPYQSVPWAYQIPEGWVHCPVERKLVNDLQKAGYDAICLHSRAETHGPDMPYRHGLTILKKFRRLGT
jgi:predicted O-methyltransferase YrrM